MRLTDLCFPTLSTTSTRASWAPDSSQGLRRALVRGIRRFTTPQTASAGPLDFRASGRSLSRSGPSDRASDIPVAPLASFPQCSRTCRRISSRAKYRLPRSPRERSAVSADRDAFHHQMTDSSCRTGGRFRPFVRLNQPFLVTPTLPPLRDSRHIFARSTRSRLPVANRNRFSLLGSVCANRCSVRRDRFFASLGQASSVDFCNTH